MRPARPALLSFAVSSLAGCGSCLAAQAPKVEVSPPKVAAPVGKPALRCFDVAVGDNSGATTQEFAARHCQGGGVTWAELLRVLAKRLGPLTTAPPDLALGLSGDVLLVDGTRLFSIDEEGDAARFCSGDAALLARVQADVKRLNSDVGALRAAMAEADVGSLECGDE